MRNVLVSGTENQVADVEQALRQHDVTVTAVTAIEDVPDACAKAGPDAFDAYVQLGATFRVEGETAVQRVRHFYADGVLARFAALDAAREALKPDAEVIFVMGQLPSDVATAADREARRALTEVLARAAQADAAPGQLTVRTLDASTPADRIAAFAAGVAPPPQPLDPALDELSLTEWRFELMNVVMVET